MSLETFSSPESRTQRRLDREKRLQSVELAYRSTLEQTKSYRVDAAAILAGTKSTSTDNNASSLEDSTGIDAMSPIGNAFVNNNTNASSNTADFSATTSHSDTNDSVNEKDNSSNAKTIQTESATVNTSDVGATYTSSTARNISNTFQEIPLFTSAKSSEYNPSHIIEDPRDIIHLQRLVLARQREAERLGEQSIPRKMARYLSQKMEDLRYYSSSSKIKWPRPVGLRLNSNTASSSMDLDMVHHNGNDVFDVTKKNGKRTWSERQNKIQDRSERRAAVEREFMGFYNDNKDLSEAGSAENDTSDDEDGLSMDNHSATPSFTPNILKKRLCMRGFTSKAILILSVSLLILLLPIPFLIHNTSNSNEKDSSSSTSTSDNAYTTVPVTGTTLDKIKTTLVHYSTTINPTIFYDDTKPQYWAIYYMASDPNLSLPDTLQTPIVKGNKQSESVTKINPTLILERSLVERYALTVLYLSTAETIPLTLTETGDTVLKNDWNHEDNWMNFDSICTWKGITCTTLPQYALETSTSMQVVKEINLSHNNLGGSIPSELALLNSLTHLRLDGNKLQGTVPSEIGSLTSLTKIRLDGNFLTGYIPQSICALRNAGTLTSLISNCGGGWNDIRCSCCSECL